MFFGDIANDTRYTKAILDGQNLLPREIGDNVPPAYRLDHIADTICNHSSVKRGVELDAFYEEATQPHIKSTETPIWRYGSSHPSSQWKRKETTKITCTMHCMQNIRPST